MKSPFPPKTDFFSKYGAGLLADHINAYWASPTKGVKAERHLLWGTTWGVKSNLVNGLPPKPPLIRGKTLAARRAEAMHGA